MSEATCTCDEGMVPHWEGCPAAVWNRRRSPSENEREIARLLEGIERHAGYLLRDSSDLVRAYDEGREETRIASLNTLFDSVKEALRLAASERSRLRETPDETRPASNAKHPEGLSYEVVFVDDDGERHEGWFATREEARSDIARRTSEITGTMYFCYWDIRDRC